MGREAVESSYIIFKEDNLYKAKNGTTGCIEFSGTDAATVIQSAINALPAEGGKIFLKSGIYDLSTQINLKSNVVFAGSGWNTVIRSSETKPLAEDVYVLYIAGSVAAHIEKVVVCDMKVEGVEANHHPLFLDYCDDARLENLWITGGEEAITIDRESCRNRVLNCFIEEPGEGGIEVIRDSKHNVVKGNIIKLKAGAGSGIVIWAGTAAVAKQNEYNSVIGNIVFNGGYGIRLWGTRYSVALGNIVEAMAYQGIFVEEVSGVETVHNVVSGNTVYNAASYGIEVQGERNLVHNNTVRGCGNHAIRLRGLETSAIGNSIDANAHRGIQVERDRVRIVGNFIYNATQGIYLWYVDNATINSNIINTCSYNGIYFEVCTYNVAIGNVLLNITPAAEMYLRDSTYCILVGNRLEARIDEAGTADYNTIANNVLTSVIKVGANTVVKRNMGYITENSGTATIVAGTTSVTVAHGLAAAPTKVLVTPRADIGDVWVSARDGTNITINCDTAPAADVIVDWRAEI